ncbi:Rhodanese-like domain protein [Novipirellula artificiosorum]|uniref:Rhodanese-like domain protein n=2 Tax=Novipirellula artificiosorum TaxID=2528016 RepID=A0A5C6E0X0_9BACT|nr:Rhodanese-like domain protein [Novipirellula artificiosorum]
MPESFKRGHIRNALNIPLHASHVDREAILGEPVQLRDSSIVVYCQSEGCPYSDIVAHQLCEDGFENILIYRGGWRDWIENE